METFSSFVAAIATITIDIATPITTTAMLFLSRRTRISGYRTGEWNLTSLSLAGYFAFAGRSITMNFVYFYKYFENCPRWPKRILMHKLPFPKPNLNTQSIFWFNRCLCTWRTIELPIRPIENTKVQSFFCILLHWYFLSSIKLSIFCPHNTSGYPRYAKS